MRKPFMYQVLFSADEPQQTDLYVGTSAPSCWQSITGSSYSLTLTHSDSSQLWSMMWSATSCSVSASRTSTLKHRTFSPPFWCCVDLVSPLTTTWKLTPSPHGTPSFMSFRPTQPVMNEYLRSRWYRMSEGACAYTPVVNTSPAILNPSVYHRLLTWYEPQPTDDVEGTRSPRRVNAMADRGVNGMSGCALPPCFWASESCTARCALGSWPCSVGAGVVGAAVNFAFSRCHSAAAPGARVAVGSATLFGFALATAIARQIKRSFMVQQMS